MGVSDKVQRHWRVDHLRRILSVLTVAMPSRRIFLVELPYQPFPLVHAVAPGALDWRLPVHVDASFMATAEVTVTSITAAATGVIVSDYDKPISNWSVCTGTYNGLNKSSSTSISSKTKTKRNGRRQEQELKAKAISESFNLIKIACVLQSFDAHVVLPTQRTFSARLHGMPQRYVRVIDAFRFINNKTNNKTNINTDTKHEHRYVSPSPLDIHRMLLRILFRPRPIPVAIT